MPGAEVPWRSSREGISLLPGLEQPQVTFVETRGFRSWRNRSKPRGYGVRGTYFSQGEIAQWDFCIFS